MPPAKKTSTPARRPAARRPTARIATPSSAATRRQVERATARFEKALEDAGVALSALGKDVEKGSQTAYREMAKAVKALQSNAKKTNKQVLKDLEKLAAAVTQSKPAASRTAARKPAARKPAAASKTATARKTSAAAKPAARKNASAAKPAASKSASASKPAARKAPAKKAPARRTTARRK
jgi:predicted  nucleic acid-binding Zn-ribbon protein